MSFFFYQLSISQIARSLMFKRFQQMRTKAGAHFKAEKKHGENETKLCVLEQVAQRFAIFLPVSPFCRRSRRHLASFRETSLDLLVELDGLPCRTWGKSLLLYWLLFRGLHGPLSAMLTETVRSQHKSNVTYNSGSMSLLQYRAPRTMSF